MILLDRDDVIRLDMDGWTYPFQVEWDPSDPVSRAEAEAVDYADILADGPFLLVVNDEYAWAGQAPDRLRQVAQKRADPPNLRRWKYLADLYAESMGISRQGLVLRFTAIRRHVRRENGRWVRWNRAYHWPEGSDLAWSSLVLGHDPSLEVSEYMGERRVRHTG